MSPVAERSRTISVTKLHPDINLTLVEGDQEHLLASLRRSDIEVALVHDAGLGPELSAERLAELAPYVLLAEGHPLAGRSAIALEDLRSEPLILLDIEPSGSYFLSLFRDAGLTPLVGLRTKSLEMVRGFVGHGLGYGLLATKPANNMTYDGHPLAARPLTNAVKNSALVLATLQGRPMSPMALEFAEHCRAFFAAWRTHPAS